MSNGHKKFKEKGKQAVRAEIEQLYNREVFKPIHSKDTTQMERNKAMNSLIFLTEKKEGTIKARVRANGRIQRRFIAKQDAASPTVTTEALLTTSVIDAKQNRDIVTLDIPNAFVQTPLPSSKERIIMTIKEN